jgi:hypothetical protein
LRINRHVPQEKRLKSGELCLLMILVSYWWEHNQFPFPGIKTLAADAGLSERQTKRWLLSLRTKGYIYVVRAPARNGRLRNQYDLRGAAATLAVVAERQIALKKQIATDRDLIAETADK